MSQLIFVHSKAWAKSYCHERRINCEKKKRSPVTCSLKKKIYDRNMKTTANCYVQKSQLIFGHSKLGQILIFMNEKSTVEEIVQFLVVFRFFLNFFKLECYRKLFYCECHSWFFLTFQSFGKFLFSKRRINCGKI